MTIAESIARISLEVGAIRINAQQPFTWASGYKMPIYNDNRLLLGNAQNRTLIAKGFEGLLKKCSIDVELIAGTATAGIPHATTLADLLQMPMVYVRSTAKPHGMGNKIEGILKEKQQVLVIEDLISTGSSAVNAITAIRKAGGIVDHCFSIFSYGFPESFEKFKSVSCQIHSILDFSELLKVAQSTQNIASNDIKKLQSWQESPFKWWNKKL
jgi:orotate phosphoribosyltransferase